MEEFALDTICEANGFTREQIRTGSGGSIEKIEIFLVPYHKMIALQHFKSLRHLEIIDQSLTEIQGLENCPLYVIIFNLFFEFFSENCKYVIFVTKWPSVLLLLDSKFCVYRIMILL